MLKQQVNSDPSRKLHYLFWFLSGLIILIGFLLRCYELDVRPLHNDEGVNHFFLNQLTEKGYYPYSHQNYHGPLYFYVTWAIVKIFNDSEFYLRLSAVLFGLGIIGLPLLIKKYLTLPGTLLSQFLIAFSTTSLYYSRYAIHESAFVFFSILMLIALFRFSLETKNRDLLLFFFAAACMVALKETYIITFAALFFAWVITFNISILRLKIDGRFFALGVGIFLLVFIVFYSGFFIWSGGIKEFFLSVPQWLGRNESDTGHFKPWGYYLSLIWGSPLTDSLAIPSWRKVPTPLEPQLLSVLPFAFLGLIFLLWNRIRKIELSYVNKSNTKFVIFLGLFVLSMFFVYSIPVKYKTPWLIINMTVPAYLLLGALLGLILKIGFRSKIFYCLLVIFIVWVGYSTLKPSWEYNYVKPRRGNPLAYVHTHESAIRLGEDLIDFLKDTTEERILIAIDAYWPLPYYFRKGNFATTYLAPKKFKSECERLKDTYAVMILEKHQKFLCPGWKNRYYRVADHEEARVYYRVGLAEAVS